MDVKFDLPVRFFKSAKQWEAWLAENHSNSKGIWLRFYKKTSRIETIVYAEALDEALCYGWIDGQARSFDAKSFLQRFTPRRKSSVWSKRNQEHVARLIKLKKMKPTGFAAIELAKTNGQWDKAYHSPSKAVIPKDFLRELAKDQKAKKFFDTLTKANTYSIYYRLNSAKKLETRKRRMKAILDMLKKGQKFY